MPVGGSSDSIELSWAKEPNQHAHRHVVNSECERVWACGGSIRLAAPFSRLMCLLGEVSGIEAWGDGDRKSLRAFVAFSCTGLGKGHWHAWLGYQ